MDQTSQTQEEMIRDFLQFLEDCYGKTTPAEFELAMSRRLALLQAKQAILGARQEKAARIAYLDEFFDSRVRDCINNDE